MHTKELPEPGVHFLGPTLGHCCPSGYQLTWDFLSGATPLFDLPGHIAAHLVTS